MQRIPYLENKTYIKLPPFVKGGSLSPAFGNGVGNHKKPLITRMGKEVLPAVYSSDSRTLNFLRALSEQLNENLPVDLDKDGFTKTGIHASFDKLRTVSGWMMNPMSYALKDNAAYRKELGLTSGYTDRQRQIATNVWDLIFKNWKPAAVKITKKSSSGPRRFTTDHEWKRDFALYVYESANFEKILKMVDSEDWLTLANEFELLWMTYIQKREQVDTPGKPRQVFDYDYVSSSGKTGYSGPADKKVVIEGRPWDDFSCTRVRLIHAGPWAINCMLSVISSGVMQAMFVNFPTVFHINTGEQIKELVDGHYIYASDVTEYDRSMSKDAISVPHDVCEKYWDPRWVKMSRKLFSSCYYARPLELGGQVGHWVGDPREWNDEFHMGNKSGHAWTSLIAKGNKVAETLFVFDAMGLNVLGNEETYLKGRGAINLVNNGDDELIYTKDAGLMSKFKELRSVREVGHYKVDKEDGVGFSGMLMRLDEHLPLVYHPTRRLHTSFEKIYCPERAIGGFMRPYWHIGVTERINMRSSHPRGDIAWGLHDKLYHEMMAPHFGTIINMLINAEQNAPVHFNSLTSEERDVLEDPDKVHYKFKDGIISDKVLNAIITKIQPEEFEHLVSIYYKGHVQ